MTLVAALLALVGPLVVRLLAALGIGLITMAGYTVAVASLKTSLMTALGALPTAAIQYLGLCGVWVALGMFFGCMTFIITWRSTKGFMALAKT